MIKRGLVGEASLILENKVMIDPRTSGLERTRLRIYRRSLNGKGRSEAENFPSPGSNYRR